MKNNDIMNVISRGFHGFGLKLRKHSPEILVVSGIVTGITATVMACNATTKISTITDEHKTTVEKIHNCKHVDYTEEDAKKDLAITYTQTAVKIAKLYAPSIGVGAISITCILAGTRIMHKRNVALSAAFTAVNTSFKEYRERLKERFGEELDRELRFNIKAREEDAIVTDEEGNETVEKVVVNVPTITQYSEFARCFDETCDNWTRNAEHNKAWLLEVQESFNELLKRKGHVFLNEVYEVIGFQKTTLGQQVGWVYDPDNTIGDNQVDFGIFNINNEANRRFVNGLEKSIWLDFNVDGDISYILA